jgi:hypothetical protein
VGWEQPRQRRDGSGPPDGLGPANETDRCTNAGTGGGTPLRSRTGSNLVDMGRGGSALDLPTTGRNGLAPSLMFGAGATMKDYGVVVDRPAGEKPGTNPVDRSVVNVGTAFGSPSRRPAGPVAARHTVC